MREVIIVLIAMIVLMWLVLMIESYILYTCYITIVFMRRMLNKMLTTAKGFLA